MRTELRRFSSAYYRYEYMFTPSQLVFLTNCLQETQPVEGDIVEIGCAAGRTTVFLNKYLDEINSKKSYLCVDTFSGFSKNDVEYEVTKRGKPRRSLDGFSVNHQDWFDQTLRDNQIQRARSVCGDIKNVDLSKQVSAISFCLIDVDLYLPVKHALAQVYPLLAKGGIIVIDDVSQHNAFDGAYEAYQEFARSLDAPPQIVCNKLGVIRKP